MNPIGMKFGKLTVIGIETKNGSHIRWRCVCDCGVECVKVSNSLKYGHTKSCGCARSEATTKKNTIHGMSKSPTYTSWCSMLNRCTNRDTPGFYKHGGRGITVCERWLTFQNFLDDMGERPCGLTLDRIDNDGNYEPGNCRWATIDQQNMNTRKTRLITVDGVTLSMAHWDRRLGFARGTVSSRIYRGWSDIDAVTKARIR